MSEIGREFQTVGPKTEKDLVLKVSREKRGVKRAQRPRQRVWMKKARRTWRRTVPTDTLKTETSYFVLDPSFYLKSVDSSEQ